MAEPYANPVASSQETSIPNPGEPGFDDWYLNQENRAAWFRYLQDAGYDKVDPVSKYAQNQYDKVYGAYQQQAAQNPNEGFFDYLRRAGPNLRDEFQSQSPTQRGDFSSQFLTPRSRWVTAS